MLQMQYEDLGDETDPVVLGTTDGSTHKQCNLDPVWNEPMIDTVEGLYDLLSQSMCPTTRRMSRAF